MFVKKITQKHARDIGGGNESPPVFSVLCAASQHFCRCYCCNFVIFNLLYFSILVFGLGAWLSSDERRRCSLLTSSPELPPFVMH